MPFNGVINQAVDRIFKIDIGIDMLERGFRHLETRRGFNVPSAINIFT